MRIGVIYSYNENWIGGTYYVENLICALALLDDAQQPLITIFTDSMEGFSRVVSITNYKYLDLQIFNPPYNLVERAVNKMSRALFKRNIIVKSLQFRKIDYVFPFIGYKELEKYFDKLDIGKKLFWIPDLQELHLPYLFSENDLEARKLHQMFVVKNAHKLVFSSNDARQDFCNHYTNFHPTTFVVPFAVTHPAYRYLDEQGLKAKYALPTLYFFCPNQFWVHKNHIIILKTIKLLKSQGVSIHVVFSGKQFDYRFPEHFKSLEQYIEAEGIASQVQFLGFLPREEQLKIMDTALAVIQPSLFEGWSTVVEDAKAMDQYIIASNIGVHQEQLINYVHKGLFDPKSEATLAEAISIRLSTSIVRGDASAYQNNRHQFAYKFIQSLQ